MPALFLSVSRDEARSRAGSSQCCNKPVVASKKLHWYWPLVDGSCDGSTTSRRCKSG